MPKTTAPESANSLFPEPAAAAEPRRRKKAGVPGMIEKVAGPVPVPASVHSLPAVPAPPSMTEVLAKLAANPNVDTAKMRELYDIMLKTEAKQHFHEAMLAMNLPSISRDGKIPVQGGKALRFASFENVHKAVVPILREHGFRMSFQPMPGTGGEGLVVHCKLIRGVYEEECIVPISIAPASRAMNAQQAIGAAIKYASRYGMIYLLNLLTEAPQDRDTDGVVEPSDEKLVTAAQKKKIETEIDALPKKQQEELRGLIKQHYGVEDLSQLPATRLSQLQNSIATYKARQ